MTAQSAAQGHTWESADELRWGPGHAHLPPQCPQQPPHSVKTQQHPDTASPRPHPPSPLPFAGSSNTAFQNGHNGSVDRGTGTVPDTGPGSQGRPPCSTKGQSKKFPQTLQAVPSGDLQARRERKTQSRGRNSGRRSREMNTNRSLRGEQLSGLQSDGSGATQRRAQRTALARGAPAVFAAMPPSPPTPAPPAPNPPPKLALCPQPWARAPISTLAHVPHVPCRSQKPHGAFPLPGLALFPLKPQGHLSNMRLMPNVPAHLLFCGQPACWRECPKPGSRS